MPIQKLNDCEEIIAGDGTVLRELLHPDKQFMQISLPGAIDRDCFSRNIG